MSNDPQPRLVRTATRKPVDRDGAAAAKLACAAAAGDEQAWQQLVHRYSPALRGVARGFRLSAADVDDVVQTTWLAAVVHLNRLQKPEAIGGWLVTTARREALRTLQRQLRETLTDSPPEAAAPHREQPDQLLLDSERGHALRTAVGRLPDRQRRLLNTLLATPKTSYAKVSMDLQMPIGSIGPTRDRGLMRLRHDPTLTSLRTDDAA